MGSNIRWQAAAQGSLSCISNRSRIDNLGSGAFSWGTTSGGGSGSVQTIRRSEEHTSELQSLRHLVCRLLLEKKKKKTKNKATTTRKVTRHTRPDPPHTGDHVRYARSRWPRRSRYNASQQAIKREDSVRCT